MAAHLGAVHEVEERGGRVLQWAGSSAGGLLAAVLACGYSQSRAMDLMMNTHFRQFLDFRPTGVLRRYGIYAGKRLEHWLNVALDHRCFKDLKTPLAIVTLDIETGLPFVFSQWTTPDATLAVAVRCSVSIPGVFAIRRFAGKTLIDGALAHVKEADLFPVLGRPSVTIRLIRDRSVAKNTIKSSRFGLASYITKVASLMLDAVDQTKVATEHWKNTLLVNTGPYSSINFELSAKDKKSLYQMGYNQSRQYLHLDGLHPASNDESQARFKAG